jgi:heat shock protein HtpX
MTRINRHRWTNLLQVIVLFGGMVGLLGLIGWIVAGPVGLAWMVVMGLLVMISGARLSPRLVLKLYGAREVRPTQAPEIHALIVEIARRAELPAVPRLFYIPSPTMNAFTVGGRESSIITITAGLLSGLDLRECAGVLAHEISHIRHNDTWIMSLADMVSRLTRFMSTLGLLLLLVNLPLVLMDRGAVSWLLIALLVFAPTISGLLQLALSRSREYQADLDAAILSGDPEGLARALERLERGQGGLWERLLQRRKGAAVPSLLRTHPSTAERIRRLLSLRLEAPEPVVRVMRRHRPPEHVTLIRPRPHWRLSGLWY